MGKEKETVVEAVTNSVVNFEGHLFLNALTNSMSLKTKEACYLSARRTAAASQTPLARMPTSFVRSRNAPVTSNSLNGCLTVVLLHNILSPTWNVLSLNASSISTSYALTISIHVHHHLSLPIEILNPSL